MGEKCIATMKYKLNRRLDELNTRVNKSYFVPEIEELRDSLRVALQLSSKIEGFYSFLVAREKLGLINTPEAVKEFKCIKKSCEIAMNLKDDILFQTFKNQTTKSSTYTWDQRVQILNQREAESRRNYRGAGYKASRAS